MIKNNISKLIEILLNSIQIADIKNNNGYLEELHMGKRTYSRYVREGIKSILDLQEENEKLKDKIGFLECDIEHLTKFTDQIINFDEIEFLTEEEIAVIKKCVNDVLARKDEK